MKSFLKIVFGTVVGLFVWTLLGFFILLGIITSVSISSSKKTVAIEDNSVLMIDLSGTINELNEEDDPFLKFNGGIEGISLIDAKKALEKAAKDDKIKGVYINVKPIMAGSASLQELRESIVEFKKSKKWVAAYGEIYTEGAYYLASAADYIALNPGGMLEFNGFASVIPFFKGTFEKLEVKPEIFRVGKYKSAVEPFMLDKMSEANKEQTGAFLNSIYNVYLQEIAASRKMDVKALELISDSMKVNLASDALAYKLVTHLAYEDEAELWMKKKLKLDAKKDISFVDISDVNASVSDVNSNTDKVGVLIASGEIEGSTAGRDGIGSDKFNTELRKLREDSSVKAIVIRINSPGGSALASDVMWREIQLTKKVKPVVASMGDVAASGGYYMAMGADAIVAQPTTITGSIGVFGMLFNAQEMLKNKLGVTFDAVKTGAYSDFGNTNRPMSNIERAMIQRSVESIYKEFVSKAAAGRKMTFAQLESLASGRVWSGVEAKENGLIDEFGGLNKAVALAAKRAKLKEGAYDVQYNTGKKKFIEELMEAFETRASTWLLKRELGDAYATYAQVKKLSRLNGVQARMPLMIDNQ